LSLTVAAPYAALADGMSDDAPPPLPQPKAKVKPKAKSTYRKPLDAAQLQRQKEAQDKQDQMLRDQAEQQRIQRQQAAQAPLSEEAAQALRDELKPPTQMVKRKVVITAFDIVQPALVLDIADPSFGLPRELIARLDKIGTVLPRQSSSLLGSGVTPEAPSVNLVKQMAEFNDSQFVISGQVIGGAVITEPKWWGLSQTYKRQLAMEVQLYDGITGVMLSRHRAERMVEKEIQAGTNRPLGSQAFGATKVGQAVESMLNELSYALKDDLAHQPFTAKVLRVANNEVSFDAGGLSMVSVGDVLGVYRQNRKLPLMTTADHIEVGKPEDIVGSVSVSQVRPGFSVGSLSSGSARNQIQIGDLVRWYPSTKSEP
jgi:hypothetical protein